jgi:hypothetical protein
MDEPKVVEESVVETETTQTSSPQVEVETTPETAQEDVALPAETDEQRKAFQEQRLEIKKLKEEVEARKQSESAFSAFKPKPLMTSFSSEQFTDPVTGEINLQALTQAQEAHITAKVTSQMEQRLAEERDEAEARRQHPDLFADPEIEQEIADRWFAAKMRGENVTVTDVAGKVSKRFEKALNKAEKAGAEKALQDIAPKEKVALTAPAQSATSAQKQIESENDEAVMQAVRFGNNDALAQAMSKIPWANK